MLHVEKNGDCSTNLLLSIPSLWDTEENRLSVSEINGEGAFEQFGLFTLNDLTELALPWS